MDHTATKRRLDFACHAAIAWLVIALGVVAMIPSAEQVSKPVPMSPCSVAVFFSPHGGAQDTIVHEIDCAESEIKVQAYSFTSRPIADALIAAKKRGVAIEVCADDSNKNPSTSVTDELAASGISVRLDARHAISHSKVIIVDRKLVLTGSFNWTQAAERSNLENLVLIGSVEVAKKYLDNFESHKTHCKLLVTN